MLLQAQNQQLKVTYLDIEGNDFVQNFNMNSTAQIRALYAVFIHPHNKAPGIKLPAIKNPMDLVSMADKFRCPDLILLKKTKKGWQSVQKYFDYQGRYQTMNSNTNLQDLWRSSAKWITQKAIKAIDTYWHKAKMDLICKKKKLWYNIA